MSPGTTAEDRLLDAHGRRWVACLQAAAQTLRLYPAGNAAVDAALREVSAAAEGIRASEGVAELAVRDGFFFVNDVRLRFDFSQFGTYSAVAAQLTRHGLGGFRIAGHVPVSVWRNVLGILAGEAPERMPADWPASRLSQESREAPIELLPAMGPSGAADDRTGGGEAGAYRRARASYEAAGLAVREALTDVRLGRAVNVRRLRRSVLSLVDAVASHDHAILAMTQLREYDTYTAQHSVNVAIFCLLIGRRLGMSRERLLELGLGALLHDVGKMRVRGEVIRKEGTLDADEWAEIQRHPLDGLLAINAMSGFGSAPHRIMLMAYEHHMKADLSGYPRSERVRRPLMLSRIVAVADSFDAGTARRSYQAHPPSPDEVIRQLRDNPGRGVDPLIVKALINVTGFYPVGTLVILDTFEMGIVSRKNPNPREPHRPIVALISDAVGNRLARPVHVDLAEKDERGTHLRTIVKTSSPERFGIRAADYVTLA